MVVVVVVMAGVGAAECAGEGERSACGEREAGWREDKGKKREQRAQAC